MFSDNQRVKYRKETTTAILNGKPVKVVHHTPILSPEQREKRRREIERTLYGIFKKYDENSVKSS